MSDRLLRRQVLKIIAGLPFLGAVWPRAFAASTSSARVRPGEPGWPSDESWDRLGREVGGA